MPDDNAMKAGTIGGIEAVVKAMNTHINDDYVCKYGCGALRSMTAIGITINILRCS